MGKERRSYWWLLAIWAVWTSYGVLSAALVVFRTASSTRPYGWGTALYSEVGYSYIAAALSLGVVWLGHRFSLLQRPFFLNFMVHVGGALVYASVAKLLWDQLRVGRPAPYFGTSWSFLKLFQSINWGWDSGVLLYGVVLLATYSYDYYARYEAELVKAAELETQLARAQLQALQMQLHPHFLFNALHTATALVRVNPEGAERVLARIGDLLRTTLQASERQEVELIEELRLLDLYLDIERTRFQDRLAIHFDVGEDVEKALVPHFILQPLVENAIRHGAGMRPSGAQIQVVAERKDGRLALRVWDNGSGNGKKISEQVHEGVGLSTTRARLERMYGSGQHMDLMQRETGSFEVEITMPLRLAGQGRGEGEWIPSES